jgi:hypothetical protein
VDVLEPPHPATPKHTNIPTAIQRISKRFIPTTPLLIILVPTLESLSQRRRKHHVVVFGLLGIRRDVLYRYPFPFVESKLTIDDYVVGDNDSRTGLNFLGHPQSPRFVALLLAASFYCVDLTAFKLVRVEGPTNNLQSAVPSSTCLWRPLSTSLPLSLMKQYLPLQVEHCPEALVQPPSGLVRHRFLHTFS